MLLQLLLIGASILISSCTTSPARPGPDTSPHTSKEPTASLAGTSDWPRVLATEELQITIYPPQLESWSGNRIKQRAVAAVQTRSSPQPVFGLLWISAQATVDPKNQLVRFEQVRIARASFPSAPALADAALSAVRKNTQELLKPVPVARLRTELAVARTEARRQPLALRNSPPEIVFSPAPTILVLIDGEPVLRETGRPGFLRVINTRALLVLEASKNRYFLYMGDRWMEAPSIKGPWTAASSVASELDQVRKSAAEAKQVDLLDNPQSALMAELKQGVLPRVYVRTMPAELLQTQDAPRFQSIAGTKLLYVTNTADNILLNQADQKYYVLIAGRWYRAKSLDGPWSYLSAKSLPADFAKIPANHRKGAVLASVAGTPQAQEAGISNELPQTARVDRHKATLAVHYDGAPRFEPIRGTPLRYAANSVNPVIELSSHDYYAVDAGVWFEAPAPTGPWSVATRVPTVIYTIPPSSPLYYVTYVRIYDATPDYVDTGYTPGYLGSYSSGDGVVVFGTGYDYPAWVGSYWIGPPVTFGLGISFGWSFGGAFYAGPVFYPWWGPWWAWSGPWPYYYPYYYPYYPYAVSTPPPTPPPPASPPNVYQGWSSQAVSSLPPSAFNNAYVSRGGAAGAWTPSTRTEPGRAGAFSGSVAPPPAPAAGTGPQAWNAFPSRGGGGAWGPAIPGGGPAPVGPPAAAPPAPSMPAAPPPPAAGIGHGPAAGQAFPGAGWGPHK